MLSLLQGLGLSLVFATGKKKRGSQGSRVKCFAIWGKITLRRPLQLLLLRPRLHQHPKTSDPKVPEGSR